MAGFQKFSCKLGDSVKTSWFPEIQPNDWFEKFGQNSDIQLICLIFRNSVANLEIQPKMAGFYEFSQRAGFQKFSKTRTFSQNARFMENLPKIRKFSKMAGFRNLSQNSGIQPKWLGFFLFFFWKSAANGCWAEIQLQTWRFSQKMADFHKFSQKGLLSRYSAKKEIQPKCLVCGNLAKHFRKFNKIVVFQKFVQKFWNSAENG